MQEVDNAFAALEKAGVQIFWWRHCDDDVLNACYQNADVLVFPSLYEGLGLPVLEAQSAGLPVITSNTSTFPEINFNKQLCFDLQDTEGISNAIIQCIDRNDALVKRGGELQALVAQISARRASFTQRIMPSR